MSVTDLKQCNNKARPLPSFVVKYTVHRPGCPKPAPIFTRKVSLSQPASTLGGKEEPASIRPFAPRPRSTDQAAGSTLHFSAAKLSEAEPAHIKSLCLPQARAPRVASARSLAESRRQKLTEQFQSIIARLGSHCLLRGILADSVHPDKHVARLLAAFAVNTLLRYLACCFTFLDFMRSQHLPLGHIPVALLVDFFHAALSRKPSRQSNPPHILRRSNQGTALVSQALAVAGAADMHAKQPCHLIHKAGRGI